MKAFLLPFILLSFFHPGFADLKPTLAQKGKLLLSDDYTLARDKKGTMLNLDWKARASAGIWHHKEGVYESTWKPGIGHTPVMAYVGNFKNVVIECQFKYGELNPKVDYHTQNFRIALDNRNLYTGHILSAWANVNNDFIETGFLLQHIHKNPDKSIVSDLLLDHQNIHPKIEQWNTALLEVVDNRVLFRMSDGHVAYAEFDKLDVEKTLISLTLGKTHHQLKSFKVWEAHLSHDWDKKRAEVLAQRKDFSPISHNYTKPLK